MSKSAYTPLKIKRAWNYFPGYIFPKDFWLKAFFCNITETGQISLPDQGRIQPLKDVSQKVSYLSCTWQGSERRKFLRFLHLTLFETRLRKKPSRGVRKYRCLEKGALKIFRKYIYDLLKHLRRSSLWN